MLKITRVIVLILMVGLLMLLPTRSGWAQGVAEADVLIRNGTLYDGAGRPPRRADLLIQGDRIVGIGKVGSFRRVRVKSVIDARGLAVAPGFINMLSWAVDDLLVDGRSMGDLLQGVTTEIFGEGSSMGPLNDEMKQRQLAAQGDVRFPIEWTTLAEYLLHLEKEGVSCNVASFIGATTIREHVVGLEDRPPTPAQLEQMRQLVRREMEDGALGIGSSLIYAPAFYA
ncbi:MAG: D-aminoacylase, partial [Acidobacteriota bacterium]